MVSSGAEIFFCSKTSFKTKAEDGVGIQNKLSSSFLYKFLLGIDSWNTRKGKLLED